MVKEQGPQTGSCGMFRLSRDYLHSLYPEAVKCLLYDIFVCVCVRTEDGGERAHALFMALLSGRIC